MTDYRNTLEPVIRAVGVRETARLSGMPYSTISNWLRGERPLSRDQAAVIAAALRDHFRGLLRALPRL